VRRQPSVAGPTKVSGSLIQTREASRSSGLIAWEIFIISFTVGAGLGNILVYGMLMFLILVALIDTKVWIWISHGISAFVAAACGQAGLEMYGVIGGCVFFIFAFLFMLSWHHWSLAYWRGLSE